jgi:hypothetical protein
MSANFQKQLDTILKGSPTKYDVKSILPSFGTSSISLPSYGSSSMTVFDSLKSASIFSKVFYLLIGIFIVMLILVGINYLVYPIFPSWMSSSMGLPGMDDSKLFWNAPPPLTPVLLAEQPFSNTYYNYTVMFDVQIDNPTSRSGKSRVFINRGDAISTVTATETTYESAPANIRTIVPNFNFIVYCDTISTDMNIACMTQAISEPPLFEFTPIKNFPIQTSIRLCIVIMKKTMEVYVNGLLYTIHTFTSPLYDTKGSINPPIDAVSSGTNPFGRIQNLRLWRRPLMAQEIRKWGGGSPFTTKVGSNDTCVS